MLINFSPVKILNAFTTWSQQGTPIKKRTRIPTDRRTDIISEPYKSRHSTITHAKPTPAFYSKRPAGWQRPSDLPGGRVAVCPFQKPRSRRRSSPAPQSPNCRRPPWIRSNRGESESEQKFTRSPIKTIDYPGPVTRGEDEATATGKTQWFKIDFRFQVFMAHLDHNWYNRRPWIRQ